jgi:hypothetical protein
MKSDVNAAELKPMNNIKIIFTAITATCAISYAFYSVWKGRRVTKLPDDDTSNIWQLSQPKIIRSHDIIDPQ